MNRERRTTKGSLVAYAAVSEDGCSGDLQVSKSKLPLLKRGAKPFP